MAERASVGLLTRYVDGMAVRNTAPDLPRVAVPSKHELLLVRIAECLECSRVRASHRLLKAEPWSVDLTRNQPRMFRAMLLEDLNNCRAC